MTNNNIVEQNSLSARVYGQSGALKDLLRKIHDPKIQTLEHVLHFRKNYAAVRQKKVNDSVEQVKLLIQKMTCEMNQLTLERDEAIKSRSEMLSQTISRLESELTCPYRQCNFFVGVYGGIKRWVLEQKVKYFKKNFQKILRGAAKAFNRRIASLDDKIKNTENNVQSVAQNNISAELRRLDEINNTILNENILRMARSVKRMS
jgi:uncharacterized protein YdcH (DUF465 family)